MRKTNTFEIDSLDAVKPTTNISDSLSEENYSYYNNKVNIASCPIKRNKTTKTIKFTNHLNDEENQFKHFF